MDMRTSMEVCIRHSSMLVYSTRSLYMKSMPHSCLIKLAYTLALYMAFATITKPGTKQSEFKELL